MPADDTLFTLVRPPGTEEIEIQLTPEQATLIHRMSRERGMGDNEFVVAIATEYAQQILEERDRTMSLLEAISEEL